MKGIITQENIKFFENEARNLIYRKKNMIPISQSPSSIVSVSDKGLILITGNDDTGYKHIRKRHFVERDAYWTEYLDKDGNLIQKKDILDRKKLKLDNPSKFQPEEVPIMNHHYIVSIADQVYKKENLDNNKNKQKELFDTYVGHAKGIDIEETKYRLIIYKNSKIIHTLFPLSKKYNRRKRRLVNFWREGPKFLMDDSIQAEYTYTDKYGTIRYIFILRSKLDFSRNTKEKWYLQINLPNGQPHITKFIATRKFNSNLVLPFIGSKGIIDSNSNGFNYNDFFICIKMICGD